MIYYGVAYMSMDKTRRMPLILASGSPRRRELLARMGYTFAVCSPDVDENVQGHARDIVRILDRKSVV